jgi:hypothetical protein
MKAPAAARALPKLAECARSEDWSYERFTEALLSTEIAPRDALLLAWAVDEVIGSRQRAGRARSCR